MENKSLFFSGTKLKTNIGPNWIIV